MADELPELLLPDAPAWRAWLEENHADSPGVSLVLGKKGGTVTELVYDTALQEALCFGWVDGRRNSRDEETFLQRYTPRRPKSPWSAKNVGHVAKLVEAGKMFPAGLAAVDAAKADGRWDSAYSGQATAEVPEDLRQAIAAEPRAQAMFEVLSKTNRFALIYRTTTAKTEATRAKRIAGFVAQLARYETVYPQKARPE